MISRCIILAGLITALSMNSGCGKTVLEKDWGDSYESQKISQIAHPNASENLGPVVGFDGVAAEINTEKYREGFKGQKGGDVYDLQLGNISGIGKSK